MRNSLGTVVKAGMVISVAVLALSGCEDDETLALAKAQKCLDSQPATITNFDATEDCADNVLQYNSQQANIIKCGAYLMAGGLDTTRIANAAKTLDDGNNQEAIYIAALTLNQDGTRRAGLAYTYCNATGVGAYQYFGSLANMATALANVGVTFPADPTTIDQTTINNAITNCQLPANQTSCANVIADSATTVADAYCDNASADDEVCTEINSAIAGAGGDTTKVADAMLCYMQGKKVIDNTHCCDNTATTTGDASCVAL